MFTHHMCSIVRYWGIKWLRRITNLLMSNVIRLKWNACAFPPVACLADGRRELRYEAGAYTVQFRVDIAIGFLGGTDTACILHQHTPFSTGDASPRQGHGQLAVGVVSTLEWCRNLSTAGFTQLRPGRRSPKSGLSAWTPGLLNPAGMGRCSLRVRKAPSGAASSADRGPASPPGDPGRPRRMPAIGSCRISCTTRWRDRGDGRSSTTLMCECWAFTSPSQEAGVAAVEVFPGTLMIMVRWRILRLSVATASIQEWAHFACVSPAPTWAVACWHLDWFLLKTSTIRFSSRFTVFYWLRCPYAAAPSGFSTAVCGQLRCASVPPLINARHRFCSSKGSVLGNQKGAILNM